MDSLPNGSDVATFCGRDGDAGFAALAEVHVGTVALFVKAYTRGKGFSDDGSECEPEIGAAITTATARLVTNPAQVEREAADGYSVAGSFVGFSLIELSVLNGYRRRTA